jgi:ribosomal protein L44E
MDVKFKCKKCKEEIFINESNVSHEKEFLDKNKQSIFITYFDCPFCQERHYVQVDNGSTIVLKRDNMKMFKKLSKLRSFNKPIPKQQSEKFKKIRYALEHEREKLMEQYNGELVTDTETGKEVNLLFTVL